MKTPGGLAPALITSALLAAATPAAAIPAAADTPPRQKETAPAADLEDAGGLTLRLIGHRSYAHSTVTFEGTVPGGLSGIDYDAATGRYLIISDDPATPSRGGARFYEATLDFDAQEFRGYKWRAVHELLRTDGSSFPEAGVDPESIRRLPNGHLLWSSEGFERTLIPPFVREITAEGAFVRDLEIPPRFSPTADDATGSRHNLVFESLTLTPSGRWAVTAAEGALRQDGPMASSAVGSPSRVLYLDLETGRAGAEYVYVNDPVRDRTEGFSLNGLVELLALGERSFLALERSYSEGFGHAVHLHHFDVSAATDVSGLESLAEADYTPGVKTLVADLGSFGVEVTNLEGLTFGPDLENGSRSLVIVSDDNFGGLTQLMVFEVSGELPRGTPAGAKRHQR
ncbi:MAG: esterase-like activity of phytase family protein [Acidobacteriota bacterium]